MPVTPFPRPKSIASTTGSGPAPDAPVRVVLDPATPAQGFRLQTSPEGITVTHADAAGLRYALATLDQLRADRDFATTSYDVSDHPDFGVRGFMLDISRDRVPTRRTLARWVEVLELARINSLELYTEHTFAFRGEQAVWQDASPLTPADLQWLDALCASRGIDLVCNQNTLGHMERFLKHPDHAKRAENEDGFTIRGQHRPPSTVEPSRENAEFVQGLLEDVVPNFRTKRLNIGADEPWELGTGKSAQRAEEVGLGTVYFEYVTQVMQPWLDRGYTVEFWADVFGDHPELMDKVPAGAVPVVWQYDSPALLAEVVDSASPGQVQEWRSLGVDVTALRDGFRDRAKLLLDAGIPFWVAPGASNWNSLLGRWDNAVANMVDAAEVGLENSAQGYLNTSWGDHGHWDPPSVAFGPVLFGGAVSWSLEDNRDVDVAAVLNDALLLDPTGVVGDVLVRAGKVCQRLGAPLLNASPLCLVLREPDQLKPWAVPAPEALAAVHDELLSCLADLRGADPAAADGDAVVRELTQALRLSDLAVRALQARAQDGSFAADAAPRLLAELDDLLEEQRACWLLRSRPGGLADSVAEFGRLRHALVRAAS
ncbi:family 20 glycosylhydrolase [Kineococcus rhizosphaerae]|uniref:beta-N-acetylhexosaminidase n=1 Tax=Kineococcus rhizosphaerae TaxID=559628 RepID=A0A2T0R3Q9_9ACTN|nr:family 20 glycosylhydrolase [Kineococcus rhizosphaerae]PRY14692.1 glycosyl hydrolase family 20 [Kineococcus rhizosphaerae]